MFRYALTYGAIIGVVVIALMTLVMFTAESGDFGTSEVAGYAVMIAVLSLLFVGIKRYRDVEHGGVVSFKQAAGVGAAIAVVAAIFYVIAWEVVLIATDYSFMETYPEMLRADIAAQSLSDAERAAKLAEIDSAMEMYDNPVFRLGITFIEIFPVGLIVSLISALILKNPKVLPARKAA